MKTSIIILLCLLVGTSAWAQQSDSVYTLEQCKQLALLNNSDIRTASNNLLSAIELKKEAFTKYFPEVSAGASAFWANHDAIQYDVLDLFTLGVIKKGKAAGIWAVQPIFMGGQIINGNKLAKVNEDVARIRQAQNADSVQLQTEAIYWQLATLMATRRTLESAVSMLDSLSVQVGAAVEAGIVNMNDNLKVQLKRNSYRADIVDADNGIALLKMLLAQQIGLGLDANIDIAYDVPQTVPLIDEDLFVNSSVALDNTFDHQLLLKNVEAKSLERKMEIGQYLPKLAVAAGWMYHDIFNQNHNFGAVMLSVTVPISGWWGGSSAIKRKSLALENARIELDNLSQKIEIEITDKWDNLTSAHRKMAIAYEAIGQSKENLRLSHAYYQAGMCTISDLLEAETLNRQAITDYITAYGIFKLSEAQYRYSTGRNLD